MKIIHYIPDVGEGEDTPTLPEGFVDLGGGYYDVDPRANIPEVATVISESTTRYDNLGAHRDNVLVARVFRSLDGSNLRERIDTRPGDNEEEVLTKARELYRDGEAQYITVKQAEVDDGDVVERARLIPHKWLGER